MRRRPPRSTLFPYTTLFRSGDRVAYVRAPCPHHQGNVTAGGRIGGKRDYNLVQARTARRTAVISHRRTHAAHKNFSRGSQIPGARRHNIRRHTAQPGAPDGDHLSGHGHGVQRVHRLAGGTTSEGTPPSPVPQMVITCPGTATEFSAFTGWLAALTKSVTMPGPTPALSTAKIPKLDATTVRGDGLLVCLRGTPSSRSRNNDISIMQNASRPMGASAADQGGLPHDSCRCSVVGKLSGIGMVSCAPVGNRRRAAICKRRQAGYQPAPQADTFRHCILRASPA